MKAITVRQPWAWLLIYGGKDIENRNRPTPYRGKIAIHAAKGMTHLEYRDACSFVAGFDQELADRIPWREELTRGAVIGTVTLCGCVTKSESPWFEGDYGFVMRNPVFCEPVPCVGALAIWEWKAPEADLL